MHHILSPPLPSTLFLFELRGPIHHAPQNLTAVYGRDCSVQTRVQPGAGPPQGSGVEAFEACLHASQCRQGPRGLPHMPCTPNHLNTVGVCLHAPCVVSQAYQVQHLHDHTPQLTNLMILGLSKSTLNTQHYTRRQVLRSRRTMPSRHLFSATRIVTGDKAAAWGLLVDMHSDYCGATPHPLPPSGIVRLWSGENKVPNPIPSLPFRIVVGMCGVTVGRGLNLCEA
jgi:hypothetical protein